MGCAVSTQAVANVAEFRLETGGESSGAVMVVSRPSNNKSGVPSGGSVWHAKRGLRFNFPLLAGSVVRRVASAPDVDTMRSDSVGSLMVQGSADSIALSGLLGIADRSVLLRARTLARTVLPFVPSRVVSDFTAGRLTAGQAPPPRYTQAAVLVVDVSGFTALSERALQRGSAGAERFSLSISDFFARMTEIIRSHGGDIDCFAGDAVLVVFEPGNQYDLSASVEAINPDAVGAAGVLDRAVRRAMLCARTIHRQLNGFSKEPGDPPLRVHSALAAGELTCVACSGHLVQRSEAFVMGSPLHELAVALPHAKGSEFLISPSAVAQLGGRVPGKPMPGGCVAMTFPETARFFDDDPEEEKDDEDGSGPLASLAYLKSRFGDDGEGGHEAHNLFLPASGVVDGADGDILNTVVRHMVARRKSMGPNAQDRDMSGRGRSASDSGLMPIHGMTSSLAPRSSRRRSSSGVPYDQAMSFTIEQIWETYGASKGTEADALGLEALLSFMPAFVRERAVASRSLSSLTEHRAITVLFIIGNIQEGVERDADWVSRLQVALGHAIDCVEGRHGGATRQITVDDKGLAMIFIFGLPGFIHETQAPPCIMAARAVLEIMDTIPLACTAGISSGECFCGHVGDRKSRCEYAAMGDVVNTGARLAVAAVKQGVRMLCTTAVRDSSSYRLRRYGLAMEFVGVIKMKGKADGAEVFTPTTHATTFSAWDLLGLKPLFGRDKEMDAVLAALKGQPATDATGGGAQAGGPVVVMVIEGEAGLGKSALLDHALTTMSDPDAEAPICFEHWLQLTASGEEEVLPFRMVVQIMEWLLQLDGACDLDIASWIMGGLDPGAVLPPLLAPYEGEVRHYAAESSEVKQVGIQGVVAKMLAVGLTRHSCGVFLEDVHLLDDGSANALAQMALELAKQSEAGGGDDDDAARPQSVLICTSRTTIGGTRANLAADLAAAADGPDVAQSLRPLHEMPAVRHLLLLPLCDNDVVAMARDTLGAEVDEALLAYVKGKSHGVPLYVHELCHWLRHSKSASGYALPEELEHKVPPTLHGFIQAQVDRLPPGPAVVLRCASVLGVEFGEVLLGALLPQGVAATLAELHDQLLLLQDLHLVQQRSATPYAASLSDPSGPGLQWQFLHSMHQEVVYNSMAHTHRSALHRQAVMRLKAQLETCQTIHRGNILLALARHCLKVLTGNNSAKGKRDARLGLDMRSASRFVRQATELRIEAGDVCGAWRLRRQLADALRTVNGEEGEDSSTSWLQLELDAVTSAAECALVMMHCKGKCTANLADLSDSYSQLLARMAVLQEDLAAEHRRVSLEERSAGGTCSSSATVLPAVTEFTSNCGFLTADTLRQLTQDWEAMSAPPRDRLRVGMYVMLVSVQTTPLRAWVAQAAALYALYREAGSPAEDRDFSGIPFILSLTAKWHASAALTGALAGPAEAAFWAESAGSFGQHAGLGFGFAHVYSAVAEPPGSARLTQLAEQRRRQWPLLQMLQGYRQLYDALDALYFASGAVRAVLLANAEGGAGGEGEAEAGPAAARWAAAAEVLSSLVTAERLPAAPLWAAVRACAAEGEGLLPLAAGRVHVPPAAATHLATVGGVLERLLSFWERDCAPGPAGAQFLPASRLWARALLDCFQGAAASEKDERLQCLRRAASGLLSAHAAGVRSGEIMTSVAAATSLAILLAPEGGGATSAEDGSASRRVLLPAKARAAGDSVPLEGGPEASSVSASFLEPSALQGAMPVTWAAPGSPAARAAAAAHLRNALSHVTVGGKPVCAAAVREPSDVAGSETVFLAIKQLHRLDAQSQVPP